MKPVFSGPSGRKPWRQARPEEPPKVGDFVSFNDRQGEMHKLLEVDGTRGRIFINGQDRWIDISPHVRSLAPDDIRPLTDALMGAEGGKLGEFRQEYRRGFKDSLKQNLMPITKSAVDKSGDAKGHYDAAMGGYKQVLKETRQSIARTQRDIARAKVKHHRTTMPTDAEYKADIEVVKEALTHELRLEKPQGSSLHHFLQYLNGSIPDNLEDEEVKFLNNSFQSIVIEHDWAQAFDGVEGMNDDGEVPMPFDYTCFEFRISKLRLLVMMGDSDAFMCTGVNGHWYVSDQRFRFDGSQFIVLTGTRGDDGWLSIKGVQKFLDFIGRQIRAACIMLDAEVAEAEERPPSAALNKARRKAGKAELKSYHVVRLHRKHRARPEGPSVATGVRRRMHVRRGHWRHFTQGTGKVQYTDADGTLRSKTWINWMLVGDISLGFVDKEYRL